jgi:hypothetical protein
MNAKHTPGPWHVLALGKSCHFAIATKNAAPIQAGIAFCDYKSINLRHEDHLANARLIAAAPDLLEACVYILGHLNQRLKNRPDLITDDEKAHLSIAIAKATGQE